MSKLKGSVNPFSRLPKLDECVLSNTWDSSNLLRFIEVLVKVRTNVLSGYLAVFHLKDSRLNILFALATKTNSTQVLNVSVRKNRSVIHG